MNSPDILIFLSDQHNAEIAGFAGETVVRTPNLDALAQQGILFNEAYTTCPLCVPSRTSLLTGQLPSKTWVFDNDSTFAGDRATFLHCLSAQGYETVLCGRMHFIGEDQRHGFTKRIAGDFTPQFSGRAGEFWKELGPYMHTTAMTHCLDVVGGGTSPVLEYDRYVLRAAAEYLAEDHEKPQCVVVGTYAPHHPYVAPADLYRFYRDRVPLPQSFQKKLNYHHPVLTWKKQNIAEDTVSKARAAYYGMIENLDTQVGLIHKAWQDYLQRSNRRGMFIYLSDHGDQIGERHLFGKQTYFEGSVRIPLIFSGHGIEKNRIVGGAVSIMDIGPTLCELTGSMNPPNQYGKSLLNQLRTGDQEHDRLIVSEYIDLDENGQLIPSRMARQGGFKFITYHTYEDKDLLFNVVADPFELQNTLKENSEIAKKLRRSINSDWDKDRIIRDYREKLSHQEILEEWGRVADVEEPEQWQIPAAACELPHIV